MSSTRHTVVLGPNLYPRGYFPDLTPAHQLDLPIGMIAGMGGVALRSPRNWGRRTNPVSGRACCLTMNAVIRIAPQQLGRRSGKENAGRRKLSAAIAAANFSVGVINEGGFRGPQTYAVNAGRYSLALPVYSPMQRGSTPSAQAQRGSTPSAQALMRLPVTVLRRSHASLPLPQ